MVLSLEKARVLDAPRSEVFVACTNPGELAKWWGPRGFTVPNVELDLSVGGSYRIAMQPPEGEVFHLHGEFREVDPPGRLVYTFAWEPPDPDDRETVVTMTFGELGEATELVVFQEGFATEARRALHEQGWEDSLDRLEELISSRSG
ncbi:MAG TPA: SRPBCC domain-containing protein [Solirubrobacterales bacterium]